MDAMLRERLAGQLAKGEVLLFTGAGFSVGAHAKSGHEVPSSGQLRQMLWDIGFPGEALDDSPLGDVFGAAQRVAGKQTQRLLADLFVIDPQRVPLHYHVWFAQPWKRMYTLNVDTLDDAAAAAFELPRGIKSISALRDQVPSDSPSMLSVHLNGRVADYPDVVFSERDYARRTAGPDPWYELLTAELLTNPVVFVGTVLDESPLWHHIELRRSQIRAKGAPMPGSYLVSPRLTLARRRMLEEYNVSLIEMTAEDFAIDVLQALQPSAERGHARLQILRNPEAYRGTPLRPLTELKRERVEDLGAFLLGREPRWQDLLEGYAVVRAFEVELFDQLTAEGDRVCLLTGTAGSGKSTSLHRLALDADAKGLDVQYVDREAGASVRAIEQAALTSAAAVIVIDDLDVYGEVGVDMLVRIASADGAPMVLASMKGTSFEQHDIAGRLAEAGVQANNIVVPLLEDQDIDLLLDALNRANRLGKLKKQPLDVQRGLFRERCGRQLLVAMIETTSGEDFIEKIRRECSDLSHPLSAMYPILCLASEQEVGLAREEAILAAPLGTDEAHHSIERLRAQHLLAVKGDLYYVRHPVVASEALKYYRLHGQIREPLTGLLRAVAMKWSPELAPRHRINRLLQRLLNHEFMARITDSAETPRIAYDSVEHFLSDSHHYWLQRGNYELDSGTLTLAHNYLDQARQLAPSDPYVLASWAHKTLRRAAEAPADTQAADIAAEALTVLQDQIERRPRDFKPYHVLGAQGLHWFRRAIIGLEDRKQSIKWLWQTVEQGAERFPRSRELRQLRDDLKRSYLEMAVPGSPDHTSLPFSDSEGMS